MHSDSYARLAHIAEKGVDFEARTVYINGEVDQKLLLLIPALRIMDETDGQITIVINSEGGDTEIGVAIYDVVRALRNDSVTINVSKALSIAALILQAGKTRLALPHSEVMIHDGHVVIDQPHVTKEDMEAIQKDFERGNDLYYRILQERTGNDYVNIAAWCQRDTYFTAEEAKLHGFIDSVVDSQYTIVKKED